jgi:hypothetical protein
LPARLAGTLGAARIATSDPDATQAALRTLEGLLTSAEQPPTMVRLVEEQIRSSLASEPLFRGEVAEDFMRVACQTVRYVAARQSNPRPFQQGGEVNDTVVEQDLADDFEDWLRGQLLHGSVSIEARHVAAGRVDVAVGFGSMSVVVELKRELQDTTPTALQAHYEDQAASYQAGDYPFGIVLVLDLTDASAARRAPHLQDLIWVQELSGPGRARWLTWAVLPGRIPSPSAHSRSR